MSRPALPPTPAASTDIEGQADPGVAHDPSWALPPAALGTSTSDRSRGSVSSSSVASCNASDSSYRPSSPVPAHQSKPKAAAASQSSSPSVPRKRASNVATVTKEDYNLPPPPMRSRKIIQMKPKEDKKDEEEARAEELAIGSAAKGKPAAGGRGKKQANGNTAAGRKIARKTAHSLIERRRRSKMNEEFGVLKDMIPACTGQEMHKLAILQASIEYMRYLERCVSELKEANRSNHTLDEPRSQIGANHSRASTSKEELDGDEEDGDEEMSDVSPTATPNASYSHSTYTVPSTTTSPSIYPVDRAHCSAETSPAIYPAHRRRSSLYPSPDLHGMPGHRNYSTPSSTTSPSILPSPSVVGLPESHSRHHSFALTSPALGPQPDTREDHEATTALLMLNSGRRPWNGPRARGMSVKDLLSG